MDLDVQQEGYPDHGAANAPAPDLQDQQRQPVEQRDEDDPAAQELQRVAGQVGLPDDLVQRSAHDHGEVDRSCGTLSRPAAALPAPLTTAAYRMGHAALGHERHAVEGGCHDVAGGDLPVSRRVGMRPEDLDGVRARWGTGRPPRGSGSPEW
jgi:hypothetical protein